MAAEHNSSPQPNVAANPDPALDVSREHFHPHLHHDESVEKGHRDEIAYSNGTTQDASTIPAESNLHHRGVSEKSMEKEGVIDIDDAEKGSTSQVAATHGEEEKKRGPVGRFYARFRIFFHLFVWLLFTGYVATTSFFAIFVWVVVEWRVGRSAGSREKSISPRVARRRVFARSFGLTLARQMVDRKLDPAPP